MSERKRVTFVGIDDTRVAAVAQVLGFAYELDRVQAEVAAARIEQGEIDVCVVDLASAESRSNEILQAARESGATGVVVLADGFTRARAIDAVASGAFCFALHPIDSDQVARMIIRASEATSRGLMPAQLHAESAPGGNGSAVAGSNGFVPPAGLTLEQIERATIYQALKRTGGNKQAAANALGIYRPRLYSKIKKYNMTEFM